MDRRAAPSLEHLSRLLLRIGQAGRDADAASFVHQVMGELRASLGFRFGWCGLVGERSTAYPIMQCVDGIQLPPSFVDGLRAIAPRDAWGCAVAFRPAVVHRWSGFVEDDALVDEFVRQHDMCHGMAQSLSWPLNGRSFVVAVYRERRASRFTDAEAEVFRHTCHHIGSLWSHCIREALAADASADLSTLALVRHDGLLLYGGSQVHDALDTAQPAWDGLTLPAGLLKPGRVRLGQVVVDVARERSHFRLAVTPPRQDGLLSPRELRVARLFASGQSYKEIARTLSLSPATVRTYLQSAYASLGVRNKVHLGQALADIG